MPPSGPGHPSPDDVTQKMLPVTINSFYHRLILISLMGFSFIFKTVKIMKKCKRCSVALSDVSDTITQVANDAMYLCETEF